MRSWCFLFWQNGTTDGAVITFSAFTRPNQPIRIDKIKQNARNQNERYVCASMCDVCVCAKSLQLCLVVVFVYLFVCLFARLGLLVCDFFKNWSRGRSLDLRLKSPLPAPLPADSDSLSALQTISKHLHLHSFSKLNSGIKSIHIENAQSVLIIIDKKNNTHFAAQCSIGTRFFQCSWAPVSARNDVISKSTGPSDWDEEEDADFAPLQRRRQRQATCWRRRQRQRRLQLRLRMDRSCLSLCARSRRLCLMTWRARFRWCANADKLFWSFFFRFLAVFVFHLLSCRVSNVDLQLFRFFFFYFFWFWFFAPKPKSFCYWN